MFGSATPDHARMTFFHFLRFDTHEEAARAMSIENRGFASVDTETMRWIASEGGKAAHHYGTARKWTLEEAREAGRLGKRASDEAKRRKKALRAGAR